MTNANQTLPCGLSKREYFAAMAMQGMLAKADLYCWLVDTESGPIKIKTCARDSVKYADALLAELQNSEASDAPGETI